MRLFLQTAYFRFYNKFVFALRKRTLRTKEEHEEKTFEQAYAPRGCCLFVKIRDIVFSRTCAGKRHLKSRERGDENEVYGEKTTERASCEVRLLSSRLNLSSRHILYISSVLFIPSKSRHLPTTFFTAAVSATRNAFVLSSAFMTGQSW